MASGGQMQLKRANWGQQIQKVLFTVTLYRKVTLHRKYVYTWPLTFENAGQAAHTGPAVRAPARLRGARVDSDYGLLAGQGGEGSSCVGRVMFVGIRGLGCKSRCLVDSLGSWGEVVRGRGARRASWSPVSRDAGRFFLLRIIITIMCLLFFFHVLLLPLCVYCYYYYYV
jgi:hypothetical protein